MRGIVLSPEEKLSTAYHESGHALLGMLTPGADPVRRVTIIPRGQALGVTVQTPQMDRYGYSEKYLRGRIAGALGGRAAEEIVYGEVTTGAESDLDQATRLARQMVGRWGMSAAIGPVRCSRRPGRSSRSAATASRRRPRQLVDEEVRRLVEDCYGKAVRDAAEQPGAARPAGPHAARPGDAERGRGVRRRRGGPRDGSGRRRPRRGSRQCAGTGVPPENAAPAAH